MNSKQIGNKEFVRAVRSALAFADAYMPKVIMDEKARLNSEPLSDAEREGLRFMIDEMGRDYLEILAVIAYVKQEAQEEEICESECH